MGIVNPHMSTSAEANQSSQHHDLIESLRGGLIVSCQAGEDSPFFGPQFMAAFARAAEVAGAVGLRINGTWDIQAVREASTLPIIGIFKRQIEDYPVYITPTLAYARRVVEAGAAIVALDATHRERPEGVTPEELIRTVKAELGVPVMADVDSLREGVAAATAGADLVATTMAGYTSQRPASPGPDLALVQELAQAVDVPVICEGRIQHPSDARAAISAGAYAVVVGTAITNPVAIARKFSLALKR